MSTCYTKHLVINNSKGFHARSSAKFVNCAANFNCKVEVGYQGKKVDGTSLIQLMLLSPPMGETIQVSTSGKQAQQAIAALSQLVNQGFGENLHNNL